MNGDVTTKAFFSRTHHRPIMLPKGAVRRLISQVRYAPSFTIDFFPVQAATNIEPFGITLRAAKPT